MEHESETGLIRSALCPTIKYIFCLESWHKVQRKGLEQLGNEKGSYEAGRLGPIIHPDKARPTVCERQICAGRIQGA